MLCLDEPGIWADQVREADIPVTSFYRQPGLDMRIPVKIARYAKENNIDIYHAHQCTPWFYTGLSRLLYSKPKLLFEEHGRLHPEVLNRKRRWFNRLFLQHLTDKVVSVSQDVKKRLFAYEGVRLKKIKVVYNGTKTLSLISATKRQELRQRFGLKETDIVVGCIGRLDPIKNFPLFIKGFAKAKEINSNLKGIIIGDGPLMDELKQLIITLNLQKAFLLPGYLQNAADLVNIFDVFTLVSFSEGTSMALLESMESGIPSIVTNVGGNPEIVLDQETGWIIPSDDLSAMTNATVEAAQDKKTRLDFGQNANIRFQDNFTFKKMINQYDNLYIDLLNA